jgi:hypothetical protein
MKIHKEYLSSLQEPAFGLVKRYQQIDSSNCITPPLVLETDFGPYTEKMLGALGIKLKNGLENLTVGEEFCVTLVIQQAYIDGIKIHDDGTIEQEDVSALSALVFGNDDVAETEKRGAL